MVVYTLCLLAVGFFELLLQVNFTFTILSAIIIGLFSVTLGHEFAGFLDNKIGKRDIGFEEIESNRASNN